MFFHLSSPLTIYFGNKETSFAKEQFYTIKSSSLLAHQLPFTHARNLLNFQNLIVLHQIHSNQGIILKTQAECNSFIPYSCDGDFLITRFPHVGLGITTADCLPLVFYDSNKKIIALAHAGWKGSMEGIAHKVIETLQTNFGTNPVDLQVFLGPCAHVCCYEIKKDFIAQASSFDKNFNNQNLELSLIQQGQKFYFDLPLFNILALKQGGVPESNILRDYTTCTICNSLWCSYRREGLAARRQITIVALK
jgi:YfiH family protein